MPSIHLLQQNIAFYINCAASSMPNLVVVCAAPGVEVAPCLYMAAFSPVEDRGFHHKNPAGCFCPPASLTACLPACLTD